ncbi:hypothetical protein AYI68_g8046 [Smittium mucronatum]|uniref:Uncharacterized protein n=1 Tax=Smittium mucronatum TaxID=133383 RepID=A0A1R0GM19_9FUNG|nr:hypothetical protein AYI68_g8046 [Smittium mucronatum]
MVYQSTNISWITSAILALALVPLSKSQIISTETQDLPNVSGSKSGQANNNLLCSVNGEFKCSFPNLESPFFTQCSNYRLVEYICAPESYCVQKGFGVTCSPKQQGAAGSSMKKREDVVPIIQPPAIKANNETEPAALKRCEKGGPEYAVCSGESTPSEYTQCIDGTSSVAVCLNGFLCFNNKSNGVICAPSGYNPSLKDGPELPSSLVTAENPALKGNSDLTSQNGVQVGVNVDIGIKVAPNSNSQSVYYSQSLLPTLGSGTPSSFSVLPTSILPTKMNYISVLPTSISLIPSPSISVLPTSVIPYPQYISVLPTSIIPSAQYVAVLPTSIVPMYSSVPTISVLPTSASPIQYISVLPTIASSVQYIGILPTITSMPQYISVLPTSASTTSCTTVTLLPASMSISTITATVTPTITLMPTLSSSACSLGCTSTVIIPPLVSISTVTLTASPLISLLPTSNTSPVYYQANVPPAVIPTATVAPTSTQYSYMTINMSSSTTTCLTSSSSQVLVTSTITSFTRTVTVSSIQVVTFSTTACVSSGAANRGIRIFDQDNSNPFDQIEDTMTIVKSDTTTIVLVNQATTVVTVDDNTTTQYDQSQDVVQTTESVESVETVEVYETLKKMAGFQGASDPAAQQLTGLGDTANLIGLLLRNANIPMSSGDQSAKTTSVDVVTKTSTSVQVANLVIMNNNKSQSTATSQNSVVTITAPTPAAMTVTQYQPQQMVGGQMGYQPVYPNRAGGVGQMYGNDPGIILPVVRSSTEFIINPLLV